MSARVVICTVLAIAAGIPATSAATDADACIKRAGAVFDALGQRDYDAASGLMGAKLRGQSFPTALPSLWDSLLANAYGDYRGHGDGVATANGDGTTTVAIPLHFAQMDSTYRVTCDPAQGGAIDELLMP